MFFSKKWKRFYTAEEQLFEYIKAYSEALRVDIEPTYIDRWEYREPPTYVRAIYRLNEGIESEFLTELKKVKSLYNSAISKPRNRVFPNRFPTLYQNVTQINISTHQAFSSITLKADTYFPVIKTENEREIMLLPEVAKELNKKGINTAISGVFGKFTLSIDVNGLFEYAKTEKIRARRPSGQQYRALLRFGGGTKGIRKNYGFMVLDHQSLGLIYDSPPQASRPHKIEKTRDSIDFTELTIPLDYDFYDMR